MGWTTALSDVHPLAVRLKAQAFGLGFDLAGITELGTPASIEHFDSWLAHGYNGAMNYLDGDGAELRRDARRPHAGATHAIVVAMNYGGTSPSGSIARYARGDDYHEVLRERLRELHAWLEREVGHAVNARPYVDSGPLLERDLAQRAGLGWFGKNTCLISPKLGSFFFIATLVVELPLDADAPFEADRCGSCTRCLDACPTNAFSSARVLDATKCISYLTIELRDEIPESLRAQIGELLFGCDICQEVCPWNIKFSRDVTEPAFFARPGNVNPDPNELLLLTDEEFSRRFKGSPIKRTKRKGLARNAAVVLENRRNES